MNLQTRRGRHVWSSTQSATTRRMPLVRFVNFGFGVLRPYAPRQLSSCAILQHAFSNTLPQSHYHFVANSILCSTLSLRYTFSVTLQPHLPPRSSLISSFQPAWPAYPDHRGDPRGDPGTEPSEEPPAPNYQLLTANCKPSFGCRFHVLFTVNFFVCHSYGKTRGEGGVTNFQTAERRLAAPITLGSLQPCLRGGRIVSYRKQFRLCRCLIQ